MKNARHLLLAQGSLGLIGLLASPAHAAGTSAGTLIQNTATATYTSGTNSASVQSNTVTVKVDELINVAVTSLSGTPVSGGSGSAVLAYQVTNTGNGSRAFNLTADAAVSGNAFNTSTQSLAVDTNNNGTYDAGVDSLLTNGTASPVLAADGSVRVFVISQVPASATDGQTSQVRLTAASLVGTGPAGTVFAGAGAAGVDAVIGASTGTANALASVIASLANLTLTKSAVVADPFGGTTAVPGAVVTYSLVLRATGSGTANGVHITDAFPGGTTYQPGTLTLDGSPLSDSTDADAGLANGTGIDVSLGNVAGGSADKTVTFKVKIN